MKTSATLSDKSKIVRTQITLTEAIKQSVEAKAREKNISLSEYLRQAALLSLLLEDYREEELAGLADRIIGSVDLNKHSQWRTVEKTASFVRKARKEWASW